MKLDLLKENLKLGLTAVEKVATRSVNLPILENVLIKTEKNILKLIATNLETIVIFNTLSKIEKEGEIVVPVKLLSNIIKNLKSIKVSFERKDNNLVIKSDNNTINLRCQDTKEFPVIPKIKVKKFFNIKPTDFIQIINQVVNTVCSFSNRPELSGIYFEVSKDNLIVVSTDSFRLSEKKYFWSNKNEISESYSFIAPVKVLTDLSSFLVNSFSENLKIGINEGQIVLEYDNTPQYQLIFVSKLIEGEFPNYKEIIPKKITTTVIINRDIFLNKLKLAGVLSSKTNEVFLSINQNTLGIKTQALDTGDYYSTIPCQTKGENINLDFNWKYLVDGLLNIKSEEVILSVSKEGGPTIIKSLKDDSYMYIVMPIRVY